MISKRCQVLLEYMAFSFDHYMFNGMSSNITHIYIDIDI